MIDAFWQDVRYAARSLGRTPAFTAAAVLTLALGIGANTAIFSFVHAVLLRTLPVSAPQELFYLAHSAGPQTSTSSNYPYFERVSARTDVFAGVTAYSTETFKVSTGGALEVIQGEFVSGNYHGLLGVRMALGRGLQPADDAPGASVAVVSDTYWTRVFGRDPGVLARTITVQGRPVSIVGVTAPGFYGLEPGRRAEVVLPLGLKSLEDEDFLTAHTYLTSMPLVARLNPGISETQARDALGAVLAQYTSEPENRWWQRGRAGQPRTALLLPAARGDGSLRDDYRIALMVLMTIVGVVLLIGCANVANLLLARAASRSKEIAIRLSLGAGRGRLVRQFLTESVLLAGAGGATGFLVAWWGTRLILSFFAIGENPIVLEVQPNRALLAFTALLSIGAAIVFGLTPALSSTRVDLTPALKDVRSGSGPRSGQRGRQALVVAQIALCMLLVAGAGLLVRTVQNLESRDLGFDRTNVLMASIDVEGTAVPAEDLPRFCDQLLERLRARPGARAASCSTSVPVRGSGSTRGLSIAGLPQTAEGRDAFSTEVTPGFFQTFGLTLVRGRFLSDVDSATSEKVVVINQTLAREYFGETDALGRTIQFGISDPGEPMTIVGVVGDTLQFNSLREASPRALYTPLAQAYDMASSLTAAIRSTETIASLTAGVRTDAAAVNPGVVVDYVRTMEQQIDAMLVRERVLATLSSWFGLLAILLACIGLYGTMSYDVSRRRRDIGIRLALGATPAEALRLVLRQAALVAAAGIAIGLGAVFGATRFLSGLLFGLSERDPATLGAAAAVLAATALASGYLPARRAAHVDPAAALRAE
jgi:predicted permease